MKLSEALKLASTAAGIPTGYEHPFYAAVHDSYGRIRIFCPFTEIDPADPTISQDIDWQPYGDSTAKGE